MDIPYTALKKTSLWWLPLLICVLVAPFTPTIDLALSSFFYTPAAIGKGSFYNNSLTVFLYDYGEKIGLGVGGLSFVLFAMSWKIPQLQKWRSAALLLTITLVLGAGIIINGVLKEVWPRPRPKQIEEFGGKLPFRPFYKPNYENWNEDQKSFPSGHAAMGFYYLALCRVGRHYRSKSIFYTGVILTIAFGLGLASARIMQGGHFFSDTLFSALIMWYCALFAEKLIKKNYIKGTWVDGDDVKTF